MKESARRAVDGNEKNKDNPMVRAVETREAVAGCFIPLNLPPSW